MGKTFDILRTAGVIDLGLAQPLKGAVGFRNFAVKSDECMNSEIVYALADHQRHDFTAFAKAVTI